MELFTLNFALLLIAATALGYFAFLRGLIYMRYFQQEEYDARRFVAWIVHHRAFDKRGTAALLITAILYLMTQSVPAILVVFSTYFFTLGVLQKDPRKVGKIKLNMTARASRIFYLACFLCILFLFLGNLPCLVCHEARSNVLPRLFLILLIFLQVLPLSIIAANTLLSPFEKRTKRKYYNEAKAILADVNPFVIGITGSYGKTSVKAALGEVLNASLAPTFYPPRSINTVMGITREIRERMTKRHKYAVIEMGAYNVGSIQRLCDFTPPQAGLVTVVGVAHLERFGSPERVYQAKSELPRNVPDSGILVCCADNPGSKRMAEEFKKEHTYTYGIDSSAEAVDCFASDIHSTLDGTTFTLHWQGKRYQGLTKLLGKTALLNILGVFTMSCALEADPDLVLAAIRNIEPVDNRLMLSKEGDVYFLRDAYNSNPEGFAAALTVLEELPATRKVLMTPGMVELGEEQFAENQKVAGQAAKCCDLVILVGETNLTALKQGLLGGGMKEDSIHLCPTRANAFETLNKIMQKDDLILIENDLPDLYEVEERF